jgi:hypothetical protein
VDNATPNTLGFLRIVVCTLLLSNVLWEDLASAALIPRSFVRPMGVMTLLNQVPGLAELPGNRGALLALQGTTAVLLLLGILSWKTRVVLPLAAVAYLIMGGILRHFTHFFHQSLAPFQVLIVLCLLPSGDGWSLDRLTRLARGEPLPPGHLATPFYGLCRLACWTPLCLVYLFAGISKIRNGTWLWWHPVNMRSIVAVDMLNPQPFHFGLDRHLFDAPDFVLALGGLATLAIEGGFCAVLFLPLARRILPPAASLMHLGIWLTEGVFFPDLLVFPLICWEARFLSPREESPVSPPFFPRAGRRIIPWISGSLLGLYMALIVFIHGPRLPSRSLIASPAA